ncbi:MAG: DUF167 domain-containing protein [Promethearchaeota archaeon]
MKIIEKKLNNIFILRIKVKPNSKAQEIKIDNDFDFIRISLKSKPIQNKANKELIQLLKRHLKINAEQIQFKSGLRSINKVIQVNFNKEVEEKEILDKLLN